MPSPIPIIDLSQVTNPAFHPAVLHDLRTALIDTGFLYLTNHNVPTAKLTALLPQLFSLSDDEKIQVALRNSPQFLGFSAAGSETTAGRVDVREQFEFATELIPTWTPGNGLPLAERLRGPNQWPAVPGSRDVVLEYLDGMAVLASRFLRLVEQALGLPDGVLDGFVGDQHRLKVVRYPPAEKGAQGVGPHRDSSGWWTFLLQASGDVGGLQVLKKDGSWVDLPPKEEALVVNIGQAFEVVSGGRCRATVHRVLGEGKGERFSVVFFQGVRRDLTKTEAKNGLRGFLEGEENEVDWGWSRGNCETWGKWQLRTKIRSHRENGRLYYDDVFEKYVGSED